VKGATEWWVTTLSSIAVVHVPHCVSRSCWRSHLAVLSVLVIVCETSAHYTVWRMVFHLLLNSIYNTRYYAQMFQMCLKINVMKDLCLMAAPKTTKDPPKCWCIRLLVLGNIKNQVLILPIPDMRVVVSSTGIGDAVPQQNKYLCGGWYHDPKHPSNPKLLVLKTTWHWKLKCTFILYCVFAGYVVRASLQWQLDSPSFQKLCFRNLLIAIPQDESCATDGKSPFAEHPSSLV